jgi:hypothetical protein
MDSMTQLNIIRLQGRAVKGGGKGRGENLIPFAFILDFKSALCQSLIREASTK